MKKIAWGIVGAGRIAASFVEALAQSKDSELYGVASRNPQRGKEFAEKWNIKHVYASYQELFEDKNIDVVYIATPHMNHAELSIAAMKAGKSVLCEKAPAINAQELQDVYDCAYKTGCFYMEAMWTKFNPTFRQCVKWVAEGKIGDLLAVYADFCISREPKAIYADKEYPLNRLYDVNTAGGALLDVGIYPVTVAFAMVESFLGSQGEEKKLSPDLIQNTCRKAFTGVDAFDSISMQFGNIQTHLSCSIDTECGGQLKSAKIVGTKGTIYMPLFWMGEEAYILSLDGEHVESCAYPFGINGYEYEIEEFCRCIQLRWQGEEIRESPLHTHRQSLRVMKALDTIRENIGLEYPFEKKTHKIKESARILTPTGISGELNFDDKKIVVYTDGGCSGNPGAGGWGCVILAGGEEFTAAGGEINTTNNRMELSAAIAALSAIEQNEKWKKSSITVYIDSQYVKKGITSWIRSWKKNGWKNSEKQPVKNRDLWEALDALNSELKVSWQWVKGHAGNKYNEICDALAKAEVEKYSK